MFIIVISDLISSLVWKASVELLETRIAVLLEYLLCSSAYEFT